MITIVSGLPRSGTSLMMQMIEQAGLTILSDNERKPDESNQRGYYEYEPVKRLKQDRSWLEQADGKVIKIVSIFLEHLPQELEYQIIFMERDIDDIVESQARMLKRQGVKSPADQSLLKATFQSQLSRIKAFIKAQNNMKAIYVSFDKTLDNPKATANRLVKFLGTGSAARIAGVVDPDLRTVG